MNIENPLAMRDDLTRSPASKVVLKHSKFWPYNTLLGTWSGTDCGKQGACISVRKDFLLNGVSSLFSSGNHGAVSIVSAPLMSALDAGHSCNRRRCLGRARTDHGYMEYADLQIVVTWITLTRSEASQDATLQGSSNAICGGNIQ